MEALPGPKVLSFIIYKFEYRRSTLTLTGPYIARYNRTKNGLIDTVTWCINHLMSAVKNKMDEKWSLAITSHWTPIRGTCWSRKSKIPIDFICYWMLRISSNLWMYLTFDHKNASGDKYCGIGEVVNLWRQCQQPRENNFVVYWKKLGLIDWN